MKTDQLKTLGFFSVFIIMYTLLDSFNISYKEMAQTYGFYLVVLNIATNIVMALISAHMLVLSTNQFKELKSANMSFLSIVFGIFTYGCTTCVITFLASIGISFSVMVLPLAGFPYKMISLAIIIIGYFWTKREISNTVCSI
ncbi:MAG TPA: hypothetical protein VJY11_04145 [Erysipelothrix sp.]|nr:hypothetical protein [Erysipelothrix sp.]